MTIDELLLDWSSRSEKGYPNLDNPSDISILKQILEKLNLPSNTIIQKLRETSLQTGDFKKSVERDIMKDQLDAIHLAKTVKDNLNRNSNKSTRSKLRNKFIRK